MPLFAPEAPAAKSFFSISIVERPRMAASRAMPVPFTPPPMTSKSSTVRIVAVRHPRCKTNKSQRRDAESAEGRRALFSARASDEACHDLAELFAGVFLEEVA